jgi:hypothetical protein
MPPAFKSSFLDKKKLKPLAALLLVALLFIAGVSFWPKPHKAMQKYSPTMDLPEDYMVYVDAPADDGGMYFIAMLSSIVVHNGYHPMWILTPEGNLNEHSAWTLANLKNKDLPALIFTNDTNVPANLKAQGVNVQDDLVFPVDGSVLGTFKGYEDILPVASFEEALWASSLAHVDNKLLVPSKNPTFRSQEQVWDELLARGLRANYTVVTDPTDLNIDQYNVTAQQFHIMGLSVVAAELAAFHDAFVMTRWTPNSTPEGAYDGELNAEATGLHLGLKELNKTYGPIEYITLVGSAVSVPQFIIPDLVSAEPDGVSCENIYGFLDDEKYVMDAAVGRIVNLDVQSASMQLVRTFAYDQFVDTVTVDFSQSGGGIQTINWRKHGSIWNGFEVADQRIQMSPGWFMHKELPDEGFTYDYMRTTGNEGVREIGTGKEIEIEPIMESSSIVAYRGHGSWHATFYVYEPDSPERKKGRLEGNDEANLSPSIIKMNIPPQVDILISCENAKIFGKQFGGTDIIVPQTFAFDFFYAGGVGLFGASEVSFSFIGQDFYSMPEESRLPGIFVPTVNDGNHQWELNNAMYAFMVDGLLNHEETYGTIGKAAQWTENRYIKYLGNQYSPFDEGTTAEWKTLSMYMCYGDPAFQPSPTNPGANAYDPWHNGPNDM